MQNVPLICMELCCRLWRIGPVVDAKYQDRVSKCFKCFKMDSNAEKEMFMNLQQLANAPLKDRKMHTKTT